MMSQERIAEVQERIRELNRRLLTLEWDLNRNQINPYKKMEYERLKAEQLDLEQELEQLANEN
jgi:hypothetical protein